jgi:hypothetical protein
MRGLSFLTSLVTADAKLITEETEILNDQGGCAALATKVQHKSLTWFIIKRGSRYGIRAKDSESEVLKSFKGM